VDLYVEEGCIVFAQTWALLVLDFLDDRHGYLKNIEQWS
jgi:hypothetical protein